MEPPRKRQRQRLSLSGSPQSPSDFDLQIARARNDQKLKSLFERIFDKYGKDMSDTGDEIDLRTGEIVVNKGHVQRMEHEGHNAELTETPFLDEELSQTDGDSVDIRDPSVSFQKAKRALLSSSKDRLNSAIEAENLHNDAANASELGRILYSTPSDEHPTLSRQPMDPRWQVPKISAKFWTPPRKFSSPNLQHTPLKDRPNSSGVDGSIWAIRTPGRPRGSTSTKKAATVNGKISRRNLKQKSKISAKLDWSFAEVQDLSSDSDDPLQDESMPSSVCSSRMRRKAKSTTPKVLSRVSNNIDTTSQSRRSQFAEAKWHPKPEKTQTHTLAPDTPQLLSSSPPVLHDTPSHRRFPVNFDSPSTLKPSEMILTPDEVKLIVQFKCQSETGFCVADIAKSLPGRALDDLLNWADHHSLLFLSNGSISTGDWSTNDLKKLEEFANESGLWWRDIQISIPHRSRKEIEKQMIRIWTERAMHKKSVGGESPKTPRAERHLSPVQCLADNNQAFQSEEVQTKVDLDDSPKDVDDSDIGISAIGVGPRIRDDINSRGNAPSQTSPNKGTPRKRVSVSPRKYY